jgi:hypothetical protein
MLALLEMLQKGSPSLFLINGQKLACEGDTFINVIRTIASTNLQSLKESKSNGHIMNSLMSFLSDA